MVVKVEGGHVMVVKCPVCGSDVHWKAWGGFHSFECCEILGISTYNMGRELAALRFGRNIPHMEQYRSLNAVCCRGYYTAGGEYVEKKYSSVNEIAGISRMQICSRMECDPTIREIEYAKNGEVRLLYFSGIAEFKTPCAVGPAYPMERKKWLHQLNRKVLGERFWNHFNDPFSEDDLMDC